jgi:hypothetical protein
MVATGLGLAERKPTSHYKSGSTPMRELEDIYSIIRSEIPNMHGWCTVEKGVRLAELAQGAALCVELGVFGGRSLITLALGCSIRNSGCVHGIDPFTRTAALEGVNDPANDEYWSKLDYEDIARSAQTAIYRLGLMPYAHLVRMYSRDVATYYEDGTVNVLHQDSNHSEEITCEEVALWAPKIRLGGYWIFDDTNWTTTQKAQQELATLGFVEIEDHKSWKVYRKL